MGREKGQICENPESKMELVPNSRFPDEPEHGLQVYAYFGSVKVQVPNFGFHLNELLCKCFIYSSVCFF